MQTFLILLALLFQITLSVPNYGNTATDDFASGTTCDSGVMGHLKSPILIDQASPCGPYDSFKLTMGTITGTPTVDNVAGAPSIPLSPTDVVLTINGTTYVSSRMLIRVPAEHVLYDNGRALKAELQIEMLPPAVLSFLVNTTSTSDKVTTSSRNFDVLKETKNNVFDFRFGPLAERITNSNANEIFLNIFTYQGTHTYGTCSSVTWFIYGTPLEVNDDTLNTLIAAVNSVSNRRSVNGATDKGGNNRLAEGTGGGSGAQIITRMCYTGYFKVHLSDNYGLWFGICIILLYFIFTLSYGDKPIKDYDYQENVWTLHPLYSIFKYGNEIHTVKTRASLLLAMITVHALFASVFYRDASDKTKSSNTIVFGVYAMLINLPITFIVGNMLRQYYIAKYQYFKTKEEAWDQKAQNRLFGFYFSVFVIVCVGWPFTVWNMGELHAESDETASKLWVASFFIAIGLEMVILYPIVCLLSRSSNFIRRHAKSVGFMYDNLCHESYMDFLKHD